MDNIKIYQTDKGSHGAHWCTVLNPNITKAGIQERFLAGLRKGNVTVVGDSIAVINDPLLRGIINMGEEKIITGFPYLKGSNYENYRITSITEWAHADSLEAVITVAHSSGCAISFFATDYAINKEIYKTQQNLTTNVVGLAYGITDFDAGIWHTAIAKLKNFKDLKLSKNFCGYMPRELADEIEFWGPVKKIAQHTLGEIEGSLIKVGVTPEFDLEIFVTAGNLSTPLAIGKSVRGAAWIQGTLEK